MCMWLVLFFDLFCVFFFHAEDGLRAAHESRALAHVYERQDTHTHTHTHTHAPTQTHTHTHTHTYTCHIYTTDATDKERGVYMGGARSNKKKKIADKKKQRTLKQI